MFLSTHFCFTLKALCRYHYDMHTHYSLHNVYYVQCRNNPTSKVAGLTSEDHYPGISAKPLNKSPTAEIPGPTQNFVF